MMIMNKAKEILFSLSSLSIFRGILNRSVPKAYYKLLNSMDKKPEEFLNAYGEFFSLISERGCSNRLAYAFTPARGTHRHIGDMRLVQDQPHPTVPDYLSACHGYNIVGKIVLHQFAGKGIR